jgi:carbonic anhydrase
MQRLVDGHVRFKQSVFPHQEQSFLKLAHAQNPQAMFITCADSRIVPELILQADPGDLFVYRNAGNIVPPYTHGYDGASAAIEYAVCALGVRHIIVCGHADCGAMKGVLNCDDPSMAAMPTVRAWLRHADVARQITDGREGGFSAPDALDHLVHQNVIAQLYNLRTHPSIAARLAVGQLSIHGWVYHIANGTIMAVDDGGQFSPLESSGRADDGASATPAAMAGLVAAPPAL